MAMRKNEIWILEDCESHRVILEDILEFRYTLRFFKTLGELRKTLDDKEPTPSLLIADLKLPDGNFLQLLQEKEVIDIPFIVLSCVADLDVLRACFEKGAVDYLTKPFNNTELIVKIERWQRSDLSGASDRVSLLNQVDLEKLEATLTSRERQIYTLLAKHGGKAISRSQIQKEIWRDIKVGNKTLDVHIFNLRKKIRPLDLDIQFRRPGSYALSKASNL